MLQRGAIDYGAFLWERQSAMPLVSPPKVSLAGVPGSFFTAGGGIAFSFAAG